MQLCVNQWRFLQTKCEQGVLFYFTGGNEIDKGILCLCLSLCLVPLHFAATPSYSTRKKSILRRSYAVRHHQFVMFNLWWNVVISIFCCAHSVSTCLINFYLSQWFPRMTLTSCQRTASHNRHNQWLPSLQVGEGSLIVKRLGKLSQSAMLNLDYYVIASPFSYNNEIGKC